MRILYGLLFCVLIFSTNISRAELLQGLNLTVDGRQRSFDLYIPNAPQSKRPLVLLYHGHFGSADVMTGANGKKAPYKRWLSLAERENFLVAIPNGERGADRKRGWNDCRADAHSNPETDDVRFSLQLIDALNSQYAVDLTRVYATGTSNGGNMVLRLAMEAPQYFAAVAAIVASNPLHNECREKHQPISVLIMNGTDDPFLPYHGGKVGKDKHERGTAISTPATIDYWCRINNIKIKPVLHAFPDIAPRDQSTVTRYAYLHGTNNTEVVLYEVRHGGHSEPSLNEHYGRIYKWLVGAQNYDIEMADEVWKFFRTKSR